MRDVTLEDSNHTDIDLQGLYRASYVSGRYGDVLHKADMQAFANDNVDIMSLGDGKWSGHVNGTSDKSGHGAGTTYPRPDFLYALEFRPEAFDYYAKSEIAAGRTQSDFNVVSRLLWLRYRIGELANGK